MRLRWRRCAWGIAMSLLALEIGAEPAAAPKEGSKFRSAEDGALDISGFLDEPYGFIPLLVPITEPAVGWGAAGALAFLGQPKREAGAGFGRPNITAVGGLKTDNGTWGLLAGDMRHWMGDRLQTIVGVVQASANLDFFGVGEDSALEDNPQRYSLDPLGGMVRARYRVGMSRSWVGLNYALADTQVTFEAPASAPLLLGGSGHSRVGGLTPSYTYDSRDTLFTSTKGYYFEASAGLFDQSLGSDDAFQRASLTFMAFRPVPPEVTFGLRFGASFSFGDCPFYLRPYITLRGAQMLRYQGEETAEVETEARWQFYKRYSVVGFAGYGAAWNGLGSVDDKVAILTGGTGFRYEIAHKYGIHAGLDVAFGPDHPILYIQVGSAWARP